MEEHLCGQKGRQVRKRRKKTEGEAYGSDESMMNLKKGEVGICTSIKNHEGRKGGSVESDGRRAVAKGWEKLNEQ